MNNNCKTWTKNYIRIQSTYSVMCGVFCLFVLDILAKGIDLKQILNNMFYTNNEYLYKNDIIVKTWFDKHYGKLYEHSKMMRKLDTVYVNYKNNQCCICDKTF